MAYTDLTIKSGQTNPPLYFQVLDPDTDYTQPMDLSGVASVAFYLAKADGADVLVNGAVASVESARFGWLKYDWQEGDIPSDAEAGDYRAEFAVSFGAYDILVAPTRDRDAIRVSVVTSLADLIASY